jgi:hypothetical protein
MSRRVLVELLLGVILLAACGGPDSESLDSATDTVPWTTAPAAPTTDAAGTTLAGTSTLVSTTTTVTTAGSVPTTLGGLYSIATHGVPHEALPDGDGYFGSGCSPESEELPDGIWFGLVRDASPSGVTFDLACVAHRSDEYEGHWEFVNNDPEARFVPVADSAKVDCQARSDCSPNPTRYPDWMQRARGFLELHPEVTTWAPERQMFGLEVWLYVNRGVVTEIVEAGFAG